MTDSQVTTNRLRYLLLSLEDRDLESQAIWGLRGVVDQARDGKTFRQILKEILSGALSDTCKALKLWMLLSERYTLAAYALERCPADVVQQVLQLVTRQVDSSSPSRMRKILRRCGEERHAANIHSACDLIAQAVERAMIEQSVVVEKGGTGKECNEVLKKWLEYTLVTGVLKTACRGPDKQKVSMGCLLLHGVLSVLMNWTHIPGVVDTVLVAIEHVVKSMTPGSQLMKSAEAFFVIQRCVEILGVHAPPAAVGAAINICLLGAKDKDDFQVRRNSHETLTTIAASVQVQDHSKAGHGQLKPCPVLCCVMKKKPQISKVLSSAKYDKILHVRKAALAAGVEMDNIPDIVAQPLKRSVSVPVRSKAGAHKVLYAQQTQLQKAQLNRQAIHAEPGGSRERDTPVASSISCSGPISVQSDVQRFSLSSRSGAQGQSLQETSSATKKEASRLQSRSDRVGNMNEVMSGTKKSRLRSKECSEGMGQWRKHSVSDACSALDFGVQVFAPIGSLSGGGTHSLGEGHLSIRTPNTALVEGTESEHGRETSLHTMKFDETLTTTKSCSIGESVQDEEEMRGHLGQVGAEGVSELKLRTDDCKGNDLRMVSESSSYSKIGERNSDHQKSVRGPTEGGVICSVPPQSTTEAAGDLPADCEALLDQTICTLQKCMEDLPLILEEPSSGRGDAERNIVADDSAPHHHFPKPTDQEGALPADTARLSQISGIEYQEDNPLYSVSIDGASVTSMGAMLGERGLDKEGGVGLPIKQPPVFPALSLANPKSSPTLSNAQSKGTVRPVAPFVPTMYPHHVVGPKSESSSTKKNLDAMLEAHAEAMKKYYMERQEMHIQLLDLQLERSIATMKAVVEHEKSLLRVASCQAVKCEMKLFKECLLGVDDGVNDSTF